MSCILGFMHCEILESGPTSATSLMERDRELLALLGERERPLLHLYEWEGPSATYGHFITPEHFFNQEACLQRGLQLAKRPTGGGITFHTSDLAFSLLIPASHPLVSANTLDNYSLVNSLILDAIRSMRSLPSPLTLMEKAIIPRSASAERFCLATPTIYDILLEGKKVGGAAQRRTKNGILHQGTILLSLPCAELVKATLHGGEAIFAAIEEASAPLMPHIVDPMGLREAREEMRSHLLNRLT